jgi:hypothetical protein
MADEKKERERNNPFLTKTMGKVDAGSRGKAEKSADKADAAIERVKAEPLVGVQASAAWPTGEKGTPMMHAEMSAAELIPTGQYANVSVGPARVHFLIDPDRELRDDEDYFTPAQRATIAKALNEAAEVVGGDVIAVQRNIVLENMQSE